MQTIKTLQKQKRSGEKISALTAYDATFAALLSDVGIDVLLVGDSLGMVLQGHDSTVPVTIEHILYHLESVKRSSPNCLIMADMPFLSYGTPEQALENAARLMRAGAQMVKLEGGAWLAETVQILEERGIPVCAHLGLTPQFIHQFGGFRIQGKNQKQADKLINDAKVLADAGASALLLECIPSAVGRTISQSVDQPVIGIGAGPDTDGQVLVLQDILGLTRGVSPRFAKNFLTDKGIAAAISDFHQAVKSRQYPAPEHCFE